MLVNGQEGLDLASSENPDLILLDMSLPVIDGWEAVRRLKAAAATAKIPLIALTAHALGPSSCEARRFATSASR